MKKRFPHLFITVARASASSSAAHGLLKKSPDKELKALRDSGMRGVQNGNEALSGRLLKKLRKGPTVIQDLEIMKNCVALGIRSVSNLILQFPAGDAQDVTETLKILEFVLPFYPLKAVDFWKPLSIIAIFLKFPDIAADKVLKFLRMMVDKKLMLQENNNYFSLAAPVR